MENLVRTYYNYSEAILTQDDLIRYMFRYFDTSDHGEDSISSSLDW